MNKKITFNNIFAFSLALFPILDVYYSGISGISIGQLLMLFLCIGGMFYLVLKNKFFINKKIIYFTTFLILIFIVNLPLKSSNIDKSVHNIISQLMYIFMLIVGLNMLDIKKFSKYYIAISVFVALLATIQYVMLTFFDKKILFLVPYLELESGATREYLTMWFTRITGCFTEPAHLAQYLSIGIVLLLIKDNKGKKDYFSMFLLVLISILTNSGNALVALIIIFMIFLVIKFKLKFSLQSFLRIMPIIVIIFIAAVILYNVNEDFKVLISRVDEIFGHNSVSISGYVRVTRGYELFANFNFVNQIFGIGVGNIGSYCTFYNINGSVFIEPTNGLYEYLNGIQYYLTSLGIVGLCLYLNLFIRRKNINKQYLYFVSLFITYSLIAALFASPIWLILILLVMKSRDIKASQASDVI